MTKLVQRAPASSEKPSQIPGVSATAFSREIHRALDFAAYEFRLQKRRDPDKTIPAVSHFAGVGYILAHYGFPEQVVVAGILHDYLEDIVQTPFGERRSCRRRLEREFGKDTVHLVEFVTQKKYGRWGQKRPWDIRNQEYISRLCTVEAPPGSRAISCADKIHNIQSLILALERNQKNPEVVWRNMKATAKQQLENFRNHHQILSEHWSHPIVDQLASLIDSLAKHVGPAYRSP